MKTILLLLLIFCIAAFSVHAQKISFKDTVAVYNAHRIHTNKKGMEVLGSWGLANIATGGIGYFTAKQDEWKYFHEMNFLWGVVNTAIAGIGLADVKSELAAKLSYQKSYNRYLASKRLYLINAGLDILYIGAGVGLNAYSTTAKNGANIYKGFGRSITLQGIFLLCFDNVMFASHLRYNSKWYQIMNEIRVANGGIGFVIPIKGKTAAIQPFL